MTEALGFAKHFSAAYKAPEPAASAEALRDVDRLGLIGINTLKEQGFFTRIVVEDRVQPRKLLNPQNVRVLIVDDDRSTGSLIELTLHSVGCQTRIARTLPEIAAALEAKPLPHLVLLDVVMPDANGFDVLNRIRHHPDLHKIPVMLLTALAERKDVARGLTLGADGYITKPVLPSILLKAVEAVIGG